MLLKIYINIFWKLLLTQSNVSHFYFKVFKILLKFDTAKNKQC